MLVGAVLFAGFLVLLRGVAWLGGEDMPGAALLGAPEVFAWPDAPTGLSGLVVDPDGAGLVAVSDRGFLVHARIERREGRITGLTGMTVAPLPVPRTSAGEPERFKADSEGLTRMADGRLMVSFESYTRIQILSDDGSRLVPTHRWDQFEDLFGNHAFESVSTLPDGRILAILERRGPDGTAPTEVYDGHAWTAGPGVPVSAGFLVAGSDVGPDGCLYTLERRYDLGAGFVIRLMRHRPDGPERIFQGAAMAYGNAEGLSTRAEGAAIAALMVTDDGFPSPRATRLIELRSRPATDCAFPPAPAAGVHP